MSDKCKPFFRSIKLSSTLECGKDQSETLKELKIYLSITPVISALEEEEDIFLYLAVSEVAVSAILLREEYGKKKPVFYTSKILLDS